MGKFFWKVDPYYARLMLYVRISHFIILNTPYKSIVADLSDDFYMYFRNLYVKYKLATIMLRSTEPNMAKVMFSTLKMN